MTDFLQYQQSNLTKFTFTVIVYTLPSAYFHQLWELTSAVCCPHSPCPFWSSETFVTSPRTRTLSPTLNRGTSTYNHNCNSNLTSKDYVAESESTQQMKRPNRKCLAKQPNSRLAVISLDHTASGG